MIIKLEPAIEPLQKSIIISQVQNLNYQLMEVRTQSGQYLIGTGKADFDIRTIGHLAGVMDIHQVTDTYKLVSSKWKVGPSAIDLGNNISIGGSSDLAIIAGPCSIENEEQTALVAAHLAQNGVRLMRGGVFKPRSSPYAFRGMGIDGLKMFYNICRPLGIGIVTEVMQVSQIEQMYEYTDVFQVGARNTQNFNLLDALGQTDKPILLKRGISGSIDELLQSAEYIFSAGNEKIILCERGIRTYETASRNTLDLNAVPILKAKSHLPVVVDPSHGVGIRKYVPAMALAAVMAGADGIIYETHPCPQKAASDGQQTLDLNQSSKLIGNLREVRKLKNQIDKSI